MKKKKTYEKPKLKDLGHVKDITRGDSKGGPGDSGLPAPLNRMMCLTAPSPIEEHRLLIRDKVCQEKFKEQIEHIVKPGDVVLDLGTGSGIHTLFALKAGASHVFAVDNLPIIHLAERIIHKNDFADKVSFFKSTFEDLEIPEKVDVIISNIGFLDSMEEMPQAVARFLKPEGRVIPESATINFAPVIANDFYNEHVKVWSEKPFGFDFSELQKVAQNHPQYVILEEDTFLAQPFAVPRVSFIKALPLKMSWEMEFDIEKSGALHGIGGWYNFEMNGETFMTTEPPLKMEPAIWSNFVFPINTDCQVKVGDKVKANVEIFRQATNEGPIWRWSVTVNGEKITEQSTLAGIETGWSAN